MYTEADGKDLFQVLILTEINSFPVLRLEEKNKSKELHNLKAPQGGITKYD